VIRGTVNGRGVKAEKARFVRSRGVVGVQLAGSGKRGPLWSSYAQSSQGTEPGKQAGHSATRGQGATTFTRCGACEYPRITAFLP
jgi:hypothetical protein